MQVELILGTAQFSESYGRFRDRRHDLDVENLLRVASHVGFAALDTAPAYPGAEEVIGHSNWQGGIHTKFGHGESPTESLSNSLKKLRRSAVEVVYFHDPAVLEAPEGYFEKVRASIRTSHARLLGVSIYSPEEMGKALTVSAIEAIQLPVNLADGRFSRALFLEAKDKGVTLFARSVFLQGALLQNAIDLPSYLSPVTPALEVMRQITDDSGLTAMDLAVGWVKSLPGVSGIIVGAETESQLMEIGKAFNSQDLDGDVLAQLASTQTTSVGTLDPREWPV